MKNFNQLRANGAKLNKHLVILRLSDTEEERIIKILEEKRISLTAWTIDLVRKALNSN